MGFNKDGVFVGHTGADDDFEAAHPFKKGQRVRHRNGQMGTIEIASVILVKWDDDGPLSYVIPMDEIEAA